MNADIRAASQLSHEQPGVTFTETAPQSEKLQQKMQMDPDFMEHYAANLKVQITCSRIQKL